MYRNWWNANPTGGGYQGLCWVCGEVGHKQRECLKSEVKNRSGDKKTVQEIEEGGTGDAADGQDCDVIEVGGVW